VAERLDVGFGGWFQCRLATDPDPADEPRGVSGWTFAVGDEPDLDRVIRFHDPPVRRSHGPDVSVRIETIAVDGDEIADHPLRAGRVDLLGEPRFEGRNGVVAEDGEEPIAPVTLELRGDGVSLRRHDPLDPKDAPIEEVDPGVLRRRLAGGVEGDPASVGEVLQAIGVQDPQQHRRLREERLRAELAATDDPARRAALEKRLRSLRALIPVRLSYRFAIGQFGGVGEVLDQGGSLPGAVDVVAPWSIQFWMGGWDADALCGFTRGTVKIPLQS
jgi:hypothetical protein